MTFRVLFVCTGNICRSPTAEAVLRAKLEGLGLAGAVEVDSAGLLDLDRRPPDPAAQAAAARRGYDLAGLVSRPLCAADFARFDLVIGMTAGHLAELRAVCPPRHRHKLRRLLDLAAGAGGDVVDPFQRAEADFERALDAIERGVDGLVAVLRQGG